MPWVDPQNCDAVPWIYAWAESARDKTQADLEWSGKWMLFVSEAAVNHVWADIEKAVQAGKLGDCAKVATAYRTQWNTRTRVICVYTRDYRDLKDVWRVREELRGMGFDKPLRYKTDTATIAGQYGKESAMIDEARDVDRPSVFPKVRKQSPKVK